MKSLSCRCSVSGWKKWPTGSKYRPIFPGISNKTVQTIRVLCYVITIFIITSTASGWFIKRWQQVHWEPFIQGVVKEGKIWVHTFGKFPKNIKVKEDFVKLSLNQNAVTMQFKIPSSVQFILFAFINYNYTSCKNKISLKKNAKCWVKFPPASMVLNQPF